MTIYENSAAKNPRPNVLWVFADQMRAQATGFGGDPNACTPNMDAMAAMGVNFTRAYAGYPLCCPFRGSLLTSVYPQRCVAAHEEPLPAHMKTIAHAFNQAEYDTFYLGKWHLAGVKESRVPTKDYVVPRELRGGFTRWMGYENQNSQYDVWLHGHLGDREFPPEQLMGYETDALTDRMLVYLDERKEREQPFFAVLSVQPPHEPHVAPEQYMRKYNPARLRLRHNVPHSPKMEQAIRRDLAGYYAQIENFDANLGRILERLRENGQMQKTHVIVFSDHGDCHGSNGRLRKNVPFEEAVRIPFLIGGEIPAPYGFDGRLSGPVEDVLINHVDIAPTTLGLCGLPVPPEMEGTDYSAWRLGFRQRPQRVPEAAYLQSLRPTLHGNGADRPWRGIVTKDGWKYVCFEEMPWLMFNLNEDPYEQVNLALEPSRFGVRQVLHQQLRQWIQDTGDSFALPDIAGQRKRNKAARGAQR